MTHLLFNVGVVVAAALLGLLVLTLLRPTWHFWPTPGPGTWQGYAWWPLFRGLNVLCFAVALAAAWAQDTGVLGLPDWFRLAVLVSLALATALFVYAFRMLGRDNSYGARDGLVTGGIYRWSRNPQNAMLVVVYGCLAIAADRAQAYVLCAAMMAVYVLMVFAEEPWLAAIYGEPYRRYCRQVPRFFKWRRAAIFARASLRNRRRRPA